MKNLVMRLLNDLMDKVNNGTANAAERARLNNALNILNNRADDGRWGKAFELLNVSTKARKSYVAKQGKADGYFYFDGKRHAVEYKTNGGRVESLYRMNKPENAFIIYSMDFTTRVYTNKDGSKGGGKHYVVEPRILKVSDFLAILEHCKAVKVIGHEDKNDNERAVQGDSVKLAKCLDLYPIMFDPELEYQPEDFEDLELW